MILDQVLSMLLMYYLTSSGAFVPQDEVNVRCSTWLVFSSPEVVTYFSEQWCGSSFYQFTEYGFPLLVKVYADIHRIHQAVIECLCR